MRNIVFRIGVASLAFVLLKASPLSAQIQSPPAPASPTAPQARMIGDWGVRCYTAASPSPCEMLQTVTQNKTGSRVMSVSIAFMPAQSRYVFQLVVPLGVSLSAGARIVASNFSGPAMAFRRCDRGGCYVEGLTDPNMIDALAAAAGSANVAIVSVEGRRISLPLSLRGFAEARNAMMDLARAKASTGKS